MITLIANDDVEVRLSPQAACLSPYITDAFWADILLIGDQSLDVIFATGDQLKLLKAVCEAKVAEGPACDFLPARGTITIGELPFQAPPFVVLKWRPALDLVMKGLKEQEIIDLLRLADAMCMWQLCDGLLCLMLHKIVTEQCMFEAFFSDLASEKLKKLIYKIYEECLKVA